MPFSGDCHGTTSLHRKSWSISAASAEARFYESFSYATLDGQTYSSPLWQAMQHVTNHSSYHRGQLAAMLRQVGGNCGSGTDLIVYYPPESSVPTRRSKLTIFVTLSI